MTTSSISLVAIPLLSKHKSTGARALANTSAHAFSKACRVTVMFFDRPPSFLLDRQEKEAKGEEERRFFKCSAMESMV